MAGAVVTDTDASGFALPLRRFRKNEFALFSETVFNGSSKTPTVGFAFRAWDKDQNTAWYENKDEIRKASEGIAGAVKMAPGFGTVGGTILDFAVNYILTAVDVFVKSDLDDQLVSYSEWVQLTDPPVASWGHKELEIKFGRSDPTGYSDWDYSVFLTISYYQAPPSFGSAALPPTWESFRTSRTEDWIGTWEGGSVTCKIEANTLIPNTLHVSVTEQVGNQGITTETNAVPISRVFSTFGVRELEREAYGLPTQRDQAGGSEAYGFPTQPDQIGGFRSKSESGPAYTVPVVGVSVEWLNGEVSVRDTILGTSIDQSRTTLREQISPDLLQLNNQAVLEIYRLLHDGRDVGDVGLRYLRPVRNILFREIGVEVEALLRHRPL